MPLNDEITERRRLTTRIVLAHQLVAEIHKDLPDGNVKSDLRTAGLSLSNAVTRCCDDEDLLLNMETFDRFRDSDVLDSDERVALENLCLHTMFPDESAD